MNRNNIVCTLLLFFLLYVSARATSSDSLHWIQAVDNKNQYSSTTFETAQSLAEIGLYSEALQILAVEKPQTGSGESTVKTADIEILYYGNNVEDINKKELNSTQKDSVELLQRNLGGMGFHFYLPSKRNRNSDGTTRALQAHYTPFLYITNAINRLGVSTTLQILDSSLTVDWELSTEKVVGKFEKLSTVDSETGEVTEKEEYSGYRYKADSTDLLASITNITYEKMYNNVSFSIPFRWLHYHFRINAPILSSRSNFSLHPAIHFFTEVNKVKFDMSTSLFAEKQSYYGSGRVRSDSLDSPLFNARYYNKNQCNPQVITELNIGKYTVGHTFLMLWEEYPQRAKQLDAFAAAQNDDKEHSASLGLSLKNRWIQNSLKNDFAFTQRFTYELQVDYLKALEKIRYTAYEGISDNPIDGWRCLGKSREQKGSLITLVQKLPIKIGERVTLAPLFTLEWRRAPISDSLAINSKMAQYFFPVTERQYLWEAYDTKELGLSFQHRSKIGLMYLEQQFKKEFITESDEIQQSVYKRHDAKVLETKLQNQLSFKHGISLAVNGLFTFRKSGEDIKRNLSGNLSLVKKVTFNKRR